MRSIQGLPRRALWLLILAVAVPAACAAPAQTPAQTPPPAASAEKPASAAPSAAGPPAASADSASPEPGAAPKCDLVCEGTRIVSPESRADQSADEHTQEAVAHADKILNAMHDDLLACYTKRLSGHPKAHGFLTLDIIVGPTGEVQKVDTQGGALLGDGAMSCIVERIRRERFDPPRGGGTMHFQVPFSLRLEVPAAAI